MKAIFLTTREAMPSIMEAVSESGINNLGAARSLDFHFDCCSFTVTGPHSLFSAVLPTITNILRDAGETDVKPVLFETELQGTIWSTDVESWMENIATWDQYRRYSLKSHIPDRFAAEKELLLIFQKALPLNQLQSIQAKYGHIKCDEVLEFIYRFYIGV